MKSFVATFALMALSAVVLAQGVYVTQGENGPVFSDKPQAGAKELSLRPLTVVAPTKETKAAVPAPANPAEVQKADAAPFAYRDFSILSPENESSVVANTAVFEVRVAVDPPLRLGEGHAIAVSLNGQVVGQRYTASEIMIPPEFWGERLPPPNQTIQLDASIVDADGQVLKKAQPIRFVLRYAAVMNRPRRALPLPTGRPKPLPRPTSAPEQAAVMTKPLK